MHCPEKNKNFRTKKKKKTVLTELDIFFKC